MALQEISSDEEGGKEEKRIYNSVLEGNLEKRNKGKKREVDVIEKRKRLKNKKMRDDHKINMKIKITI